MTPDEIRAEYVETLAEILFLAWTGWRGIEGYVWADCEQGMREDFFDHADAYLGRFARKGLLPTASAFRSAYQPDGTPLGYTERQLLTGWQRMPAPQPCQCAPDVCMDPVAADPASGCTREVAE